MSVDIRAYVPRIVSGFGSLTILNAKLHARTGNITSLVTGQLDCEGYGPGRVEVDLVTIGRRLGMKVDGIGNLQTIVSVFSAGTGGLGGELVRIERITVAAADPGIEDPGGSCRYGL